MPRTLITTETARAMAALSAEYRRNNPLKAVPPGYKVVKADYPEFAPADNSVKEARLARIRTQLALLDSLVETELELDKPDTRKIKDITESQSKLAAQEKLLQGRKDNGRRSPSVTDSPEQVQQPTEQATVIVPVTPTLQSVNAPIQPGISAMPENG